MASLVTLAPVIQYVGDWPSLSSTQLSVILAVNFGSLLAAWILLRLIWPIPTDKELRDRKELEVRIQALQQQYGSASDGSNPIECLEGESAGDYSVEWTSTFDLVFVILMAVLLAALCVWTELTHPELWGNYLFWLEQTPKVGLMMFVSIGGGLMCRYFCRIDEDGYIITSKSDTFKVNYTRKLQHFAAYLIPLMMHTHAAAGIEGPLTLTWGNWFTLLGFLILIKPIRERSTFVMLQFNSLDRPEDRPNTLSWIVGGNILPGCVMIIFFKWLYALSGQQDMVYIFVFITGLGDGFAEPVGIYLGKHKYWTTSCFGDRKYQRSWEGSACVFISGVIFVSLFWYTFESALQFWIALALVPPAMAYAEATSPHTIDTPFLMGVGGGLLWVISHIDVKWE